MFNTTLLFCRKKLITKKAVCFILATMNEDMYLVTHFPCKMHWQEVFTDVIAL